MLCTLHGAFLASSVTLMTPWLVVNTAVRSVVGVGLGSGGSPTSKRLPAVSLLAFSAYLHGPEVFFAARALIGAAARLGRGAAVLDADGEADGEALFEPVDAAFAVEFLLSCRSMIVVTTTTATTTRTPITEAITFNWRRRTSRCWRRTSWRSRWRRAASRRCLLVGTRGILFFSAGVGGFSGNGAEFYETRSAGAFGVA